MPAVENACVLRGDKLGDHGRDIDFAPPIRRSLVFALYVAHCCLHVQTFLQFEELFHLGLRVLVRATGAHHRRLGVRSAQDANDVAVAFHRIGNVIGLLENTFHQLVEYGFEQLLRTRRPHRHHLPIDGDARIHHRICDKLSRFLFVEARLLHLPLDDFLRARRELVHVNRSRVLSRASDALHHLEVIDIVGEHHERLTLRLHCDLPISSRAQLVLVGDGYHVEFHAALRCAINGVVDIAVERKIVGTTAELALLEYLLEQHLLDALSDLRHVGGNLRYFARDVLFLVGEEVVSVALARHVVLAHQAVKRSLKPLAQVDLVGAHIVDHERGDVVQRALEIPDVADEIEQLEHVHVFGLQNLVRLSRARCAVDHLQDTVLQVFRYGVEKAPERNKSRGLLILHHLCRLLERRQHRALARRHMLRLHAMLANLGHHVGKHLELIGNERVRIDEIALGFVSQKVATRAFESE